MLTLRCVCMCLPPHLRELLVLIHNLKSRNVVRVFIPTLDSRGSSIWSRFCRCVVAHGVCGCRAECNYIKVKREERRERERVKRKYFRTKEKKATTAQHGYSERCGWFATIYQHPQIRRGNKRPTLALSLNITFYLVKVGEARKKRAWRLAGVEMGFRLGAAPHHTTTTHWSRTFNRTYRPYTLLIILLAM